MTPALALLVAVSAADVSAALKLVRDLSVALENHDARAVQKLVDPRDGVWFWRTDYLCHVPARHLPPAGLAPDEVLGESYFDAVRELLAGVKAPLRRDARGPKDIDQPFATLHTRGLNALFAADRQYCGREASRLLAHAPHAVLESRGDGHTLYVLFSARGSRLYLSHVMMFDHEV